MRNRREDWTDYFLYNSQNTKLNPGKDELLYLLEFTMYYYMHRLDWCLERIILFI